MKMPVVSFVLYKVAQNWIAGNRIVDAIHDSKLANSKGFSVILNYLGEEIKDRKKVEQSVKEYRKLLDSIKSNGIDGCISIKLTQLGLNIDEDYCKKNLEHLVKYAKRRKMFIWIDMESSKLTSSIIGIYSSAFQKNKNVGICIQSYLRRSGDDLRDLVKIGGKIRLVKGAYNEDESAAYKSKDEISKNYGKLMDFLFKNSRSLFSIATHDDGLIEMAEKLNEKYHKNFEFGMLKGIRNNLKLELSANGYRVTEYIPYGENWLPYSMRRIRENPSNVLLLLRSLISKF